MAKALCATSARSLAARLACFRCLPHTISTTQSLHRAFSDAAPAQDNGDGESSEAADEEVIDDNEIGARYPWGPVENQATGGDWHDRSFPLSAYNKRGLGPEYIVRDPAAPIQREAGKKRDIQDLGGEDDKRALLDFLNGPYFRGGTNGDFSKQLHDRAFAEKYADTFNNSMSFLLTLRTRELKQLEIPTYDRRRILKGLEAWRRKQDLFQCEDGIYPYQLVDGTPVKQPGFESTRETPHRPYKLSNFPEQQFVGDKRNGLYWFRSGYDIHGRDGRYRGNEPGWFPTYRKRLPRSQTVAQRAPFQTYGEVTEWLEFLHHLVDSGKEDDMRREWEECHQLVKICQENPHVGGSLYRWDPKVRWDQWPNNKSPRLPLFKAQMNVRDRKTNPRGWWGFREWKTDRERERLSAAGKSEDEISEWIQDNITDNPRFQRWHEKKFQLFQPEVKAWEMKHMAHVDGLKQHTKQSRDYGGALDTAFIVPGGFQDVPNQPAQRQGKFGPRSTPNPFDNRAKFG